jgi:hypothetical protein
MSELHQPVFPRYTQPLYYPVPLNYRPRLNHHTRFRLPLIAIALITMCGGFIIAWLIAALAQPSARPSVERVPSFPSVHGYAVVAKPSISVELINQVLELYHSPARGKGQILYNYGVKYGIDPAYALAFFMHESTFGTQGVARVTRSLGNIRATPGHPSYQGYRLYHTWEEGFEDWYRLIATIYVDRWGLNTIDKIIPVYAPNSDHNDEAGYIRAVKYAVNRWRVGEIAV